MTGPSFSIREMIDRLVAFDTTSAYSNLPLIDFTEDYLKEWQIPCQRIVSPAGTHANLFATVGPAIPGGVVLSGHSDVVPVTGQPWSSDPFTVVEKQDRLYGRGTADMKSFLAIALALVPHFKSLPLKRPLHIAMSYDEEVGCMGVGPMIKHVTAHLPLPEMVIIGEPSSMQIVNGNKGIVTCRTQITGKAAHSSLPDAGANAIVAGARLVGFLNKLAREFEASARPDSPFHPPYTTFNIGRFDGGKAINIIAQDCLIEWEFRPTPDTNVAALKEKIFSFLTDEILPDLRANAPEATIETQVMADVPGLAPETDGAAEALIRHLSGANASSVVSFCTEGGLFQEAGFSTVVFGPGSIEQAHQPDEFIALEQIAACEDFLRKLAQWACEK
ncbi:MAG: acetylornithine deacetylase [Pseudomonadota bacterium]